MKRTEILNLSRLKATSLIFFFLLPIFSSAQSAVIDSLLNVLPMYGEDPNRVSVLNDLSYEYHRTDLKKTIDYGIQALELAEKLNIQKEVADACYYISIGYTLSGENEKAKKMIEHSLEVALKINDQKSLANGYNAMGILLQEQGKNKEAIIDFQKALKISEENKFDNTKAFVLGNLAELFESLGDDESAKKYFLEAVKFARRTNRPMLLINSFLDLGGIYQKDKEYKKALEFFEIGYEKAKLISDKHSICISLRTMSEINMEIGKIEIAIIQAKEAVRVSEELNDKFIIGENILHLAQYYRKNDNLPSAVSKAQRALEIGKEFSFPQMEIDAAMELSIIYEKMGKFKVAYEYLDQFQILKDSIFSNEKTKHISELQQKYETEKKETENQLLKAIQKEHLAKIQEQKTFLISGSIISILIAALCIFIYNSFKSKNENFRVLEERVKERTKELEVLNSDLQKSNGYLERFAHIASHDLKEPLRNISSFVRLLQFELDIPKESKAEEYMNFVTKNTKQMHQLIEDVLEFSKMSNEKENLEELDVAEVFQKIESSISLSLAQRNVVLEKPDNLPTLLGQSSKMFFLFKNLIENGIKYNESAEPKIMVKYSSSEKFHSFAIADNGIGIEKEYFDQIFKMFKRLHDRNSYDGTGLGLSLCKRIVTEMDGKIWVESELGKGSTFYIDLPKTEIPKIEYEEEIEQVKTENYEKVTVG